MTRSLEVNAHLDNTPEVVIGYIADVRNRPLFLPSLKSVTDIQGDPSAAGATWKWTWSALGMEIQGTGRCTAHEPGRLYAFQTEGAVGSTWSYRAEAEAGGTRLRLQVEYIVPENTLARLPAEPAIAAMEKSEADQAVQNLKTILDR